MNNEIEYYVIDNWLNIFYECAYISTLYCKYISLDLTVTMYLHTTRDKRNLSRRYTFPSSVLE